MNDHDPDIHKKMRNQRRDQNSVGFPQKLTEKAVPDDERRIRPHQEKYRQILPQSGHIAFEPIPGDIKVKQSAGGWVYVQTAELKGWVREDDIDYIR